ncbi:MAG: PDR/VanB family oxidoreductase [Alphaproteobacteria bacterium]|nr:PDR/VanB family oxidoreductase [Alphaproteobacteria bacterium]
MTSLRNEFTVEVAAITKVAEAINSFRLIPAPGSKTAQLPRFSAGAHVTVTMATAAGRKIRNSYSLMGDLQDRSSYEISVLRTPNSRGGSIFMHDSVQVGSRLELAGPVNLFALDLRAKRVVLMAGGIGVTPIMAMAEQLLAAMVPFELHYAFRNVKAAAFVEQLARSYPAQFRGYDDSAGQSMPIRDILAHQRLGTHLYVCGPGGMIDAALAQGAALGWPKQNLHSERFLAPAGGEPFEVILQRSNRRIRIGESESILEALEAAGLNPPYLCRGGACGQCETRVLAHDGEINHCDLVLSPAERARGDRMMICVSRLVGKSLTLEC